MAERFMVDDAGTLINMETRDTYDYVEEVCPVLNEQEERINELELENAKHIGDGEWDIRDITYGHGKFRLEEWGERYHQFYDGDKPLEDETVVSLLFENDKLKQQIETKNQQIKELEKENYILTVTVQRNESYIERLMTKGKWSNAGDVE